MRKIMNDPQRVVSEMCNGICMSNPELEFIEHYNVLKKRDINSFRRREGI